MTRTFKVGDFIRIKEGTHDPYMPESRCGVLIEKLLTVESTRGAKYVWNVFMTNGAELRFHEMFLEHAYEDNKEEGENE